MYVGRWSLFKNINILIFIRTLQSCPMTGTIFIPILWMRKLGLKEIAVCLTNSSIINIILSYLYILLMMKKKEKSIEIIRKKWMLLRGGYNCHFVEWVSELRLAQGQTVGSLQVLGVPSLPSLYHMTLSCLMNIYRFGYALPLLFLFVIDDYF